jgi:hypothetical protein
VLKIYVAGPYTKPDPCINTHNAIKVADRLLELGYVPHIPHLTHFWHTVSPKPYNLWLQYDAHWVLVCDVVLRLSGESTGADGEVKLAQENGKPVVHSIDELVKKFPITSRGTTA